MVAFIGFIVCVGAFATFIMAIAALFHFQFFAGVGMLLLTYILGFIGNIMVEQ